MDNALIIVAKEPVPGTTKTRLCPPFGPDDAARFYQCLMLDTLALAARLEIADRTVAYAPFRARGFFEGIVTRGTRLVPQKGADLGERLSHALAEHFDLGYRRVVIMNSDGPTLPLAYLVEAFTGLEGADVTLGPGHDGGYYLIGMTRPHPPLFHGIDWSTERVIPQTLAICRDLGLTVHQLPGWYDVDVEADLDRLIDDLQHNPSLAPYTWGFLREWMNARSDNASPG
jgi:rSAM/selenodomain-associated transferase 1